MAWFTRKKKEPENRYQKLPKYKQMKRSGFVASVTDRLKSGWTGTSVDPDQLVFDSQKTLRARSRDAYYNNAYAARFVQIYRSNVIGKNGFKLQSKVTGFDNKADPLARQAIENAWKDFTCNPEHFDYRGLCGLKGMSDLAANSKSVDGEAFIRIRKGGKYGIQLEIVDAELLDSQYHAYTKNERNVIRSSIEYNDKNEPVAYHVSIPEKSSTSYYGAYTYGKRTFDRVPRSEMFHIFGKDIVGLSRGFPPMSNVLEDMLHMAKFQEATLVNARASASKMGFFRDPDGISSYTGDSEDQDGIQLADFEAGSLEYIGNLEFQAFNPQFPAEQYEKFMTQSLRTIASGLGINYNDLANNLSDVNYSSIRHGALEVREHWHSEQRMFINEFLTPLFKIWLTKQYEQKTISITPKNGAEGRPLGRGIDWYLPHEFVGRSFDWIDPQKDISSVEKQVELKVKSLSEVIRESGRDPDEVFAEIAEEKQKFKELGITPEEVLTNEQQATGNPEQQDTVSESGDSGSEED